MRDWHSFRSVGRAMGLADLEAKRSGRPCGMARSITVFCRSGRQQVTLRATDTSFRENKATNYA